MADGPHFHAVFEGNDLIATWVDWTSKMIVAKALEGQHSTAADLARFTFETICYRFGIPSRLTHDNDVWFKPAGSCFIIAHYDDWDTALP